MLSAFAPRGSAGTIATFADPAVDGSTPLFLVDSATLSGGWSGSGLTLITPISGQIFENATFSMTPVSISGGGILSAGTIQFFEDIADGGGLILQIDFDAGTLNLPFGFGASFAAGDNVTFSGPIIPGPLTDETFAFSFANPQPAGQQGTSYTAAFTSSAIP
ncbi:MAG: hypothetical protein D6744_05435, partial [Planctomycetota bacterium]